MVLIVLQPLLSPLLNMPTSSLAQFTLTPLVQLARVFLDNIYRHHGLRRTIISDCDPKFTSTFWQTQFKSM
jgi:hypothetical protein